MLSQAPEGHAIGPHWRVVDMLSNVYLRVDDVVALYREFKESRALIDYDICEQPWDCREFGIEDLDGYDIAFGQPIIKS